MSNCVELQEDCDVVGTDWVWNWSSRPEAVPPRSVLIINDQFEPS